MICGRTVNAESPTTASIQERKPSVDGSSVRDGMLLNSFISQSQCGREGACESES